MFTTFSFLQSILERYTRKGGTMKKVILLTILFVFFFIQFPISSTHGYVISDIQEVQTIGVPQNDFIGSASIAEVNFYEDDYNTKYIFPMQGMCVTNDDLIAVIDNGYGKIHVLTPLLQEKFSFGSLKDFVYPTDIAFYNNKFYIVDPFKREVRIYTKDGYFVKSVQKNILTSPIGIAVLNDFVYVSDYFSHMLFKFDANFNVVSEAKINFPLGVSSDSKGRIYVVSGSEDKVYAFDSNLHLIKAFGDDILTFPVDVAVSASSTIYVVDRGITPSGKPNPKIAMYNSSFNLIDTFGTLSSSTTFIPNGSFLTPASIAINSTGSVFVFDTGYYFYLESNPSAPFGYPAITRISVFSPSGYFITKKDFLRDSSNGILLNPLSASLDERGNTWVLNKGNLDKSEILQFGPDGNLLKRILKIGSNELPSLTSIYADKKGQVIAIGDNQILLFNTSGTFKLNLTNTNFGSLKKIIFYNGYYYATSFEKGSVIKLDGNFKIVSTFAVCALPSGIAFDSKGNAYVTSLSDNMVHVYSPSFKEFGKFGGAGKNNFKLYIPEDVAVDKNDVVFVANSENGKITVFTNTGAPLFETQSNYPGITSIELLDSHIIVSDAFHSVVRIFEIEKQYVDYAFTVSVNPPEITLSTSDFANIYILVTNTGTKKDVYSVDVSSTNRNFRVTMGEGNNFTLESNASKRIKILLKTVGDVKDGDTGDIIARVTSSYGKFSITASCSVRISSILTPSLYIEEGNDQLGNDISVPFYIKNAQGIRGISFDLIYDKNRISFSRLSFETEFSDSVVLTAPMDKGITVLIEFSKSNYIFGTQKIGAIVFKTLTIGSSILQIDNAKYANVVDIVKDFDSVFPSGITVTPYLSVDIPQNYTTTKESVTITGKSSLGCKLTINGNLITLNPDGTFSFKFNISAYTTTLTITSTAPTGEETTITRVINFAGKLKVTIVLQVNNPYMYVNGEKCEIDPGRGTAPVIIPGWNRVVLPIRAIVEKLGGIVDWDPRQQIVIIKMENKTIELQIGNNIARVNGREVVIDSSNPLVKPIIINDRTMVPLRFVAEQIGCSVLWSDKDKKITLEYVFP
uniref:Copper amine oxidase-like N-terminal domain-containing protein n=1 Tax=Caldisericum exile TaxID=693075 RepID=A0A7C4U176_9BACT